MKVTILPGNDAHASADVIEFATAFRALDDLVYAEERLAEFGCSVFTPDAAAQFDHAPFAPAEAFNDWVDTFAAGGHVSRAHLNKSNLEYTRNDAA